VALRRGRAVETAASRPWPVAVSCLAVGRQPPQKQLLQCRRWPRSPEPTPRSGIGCNPGPPVPQMPETHRRAQRQRLPDRAGRRCCPVTDGARTRPRSTHRQLGRVSEAHACSAGLGGAPRCVVVVARRTPLRAPSALRCTPPRLAEVRVDFETRPSGAEKMTMRAFRPSTGNSSPCRASTDPTDSIASSRRTSTFLEPDHHGIVARSAFWPSIGFTTSSGIGIHGPCLLGRVPTAWSKSRPLGSSSGTMAHSWVRGGSRARQTLPTSLMASVLPTGRSGYLQAPEAPRFATSPVQEQPSDAMIPEPARARLTTTTQRPGHAHPQRRSPASGRSGWHGSRLSIARGRPW
jgi:hypothetical protein